MDLNGLLQVRVATPLWGFVEVVQAQPGPRMRHVTWGERESELGPQGNLALQPLGLEPVGRSPDVSRVWAVRVPRLCMSCSPDSPTLGQDTLGASSTHQACPTSSSNRDREARALGCPPARLPAPQLTQTALTRLRLKVFQVYFILVFVYILMPAHHYNCKFELRDKNQHVSVISGQDEAPPPRVWPELQSSCSAAARRVPSQTPFPECPASSESAS